jgi:hypothetical protein
LQYSLNLGSFQRGRRSLPISIIPCSTTDGRKSMPAGQKPAFQRRSATESDQNQ